MSRDISDNHHDNLVIRELFDAIAEVVFSAGQITQEKTKKPEFCHFAAFCGKGTSVLFVFICEFEGFKTKERQLTWKVVKYVWCRTLGAQGSIN